MDTVQFGSIAIAQDKAHAAAAFRRTTKSVYDEMEKGGAGLRYLNLRGFVTSEGGELLVQDGRVVGAIGCSGGSGAQDGVVCRAGADAVKR
jgi:glc operon protein GlcG